MRMSIVGLLVIGLLAGLIVAAFFAFSRSSNEKKDE